MNGFFYLFIPTLIIFVVMTGGGASIVRAAIVGVLAYLAPLLGRVYAPRNGIVFAALFMTLENPNVLVYDLGFQLSFLALLGIIYLKPAIQKITGFGLEKGIFNWRDHLLTTASAQIMVAPILIRSFSIPEIVDWGMPVSCASSAWLSS